MLIGFDTATANVTVALWADGKVLASYDDTNPMRHGEALAPAIDRVLREAGATPADLTGIAVGVGPGPFTGLRVGVVTARTMGMVLGIPVHGVCSLDVVAADVDLPEFVVATDARRKEVYLGSYANGRRTHGPAVVRPADVATDKPVAGRGALLYPEAFPNAVGPLDPSAASLCRLVAEGAVEILEPEPLYLRRPDAAVPSLAKRVS